MAANTVRDRPTGSPALDDYDAAVDDFLRDLPDVGNNQIDDTPMTNTDRKDENDDDENIQIRKKRKPVAKLDEELLLSSQGIPKLRKITKSRLRFKGKGHEFSDMERLFGLYQLWMDDMFPRAKFKDGVTMVERLGHKKRLQVYRKAWIDESKPTTVAEDEERLEDVQLPQPNHQHSNRNHSDDGDSQGDGLRNRPNISNNEAPEDDELDALMAEQESTSAGNIRHQHRPDLTSAGPPEEDELDDLINQNTSSIQNDSQPKKVKMIFEEDEDDEDELDALLAEQEGTTAHEANSNPQPTAKQPAVTIPNFEDDEEALAELGW